MTVTVEVQPHAHPDSLQEVHPVGDRAYKAHDETTQFKVGGRGGDPRAPPHLAHKRWMVGAKSPHRPVVE